SAGARDSAQYPLVIEEPSPLAIATTALPTAAVHTPFVAQLQATGGTAPYFWTVVGLDAVNLTLTPNTGEISGTPETEGQFLLLATVTDQTQAKQVKTVTLTVGPEQTEEEEEEGATLRITTASFPEGTVGTAFTAQLTGSGGKTPYTWSFSSVL